MLDYDAANVAADDVVSGFKAKVKQQQIYHTLSITRESSSNKQYSDDKGQRQSGKQDFDDKGQRQSNKQYADDKGQRKSSVHSKIAGELFLCTDDRTVGTVGTVETYLSTSTFASSSLLSSSSSLALAQMPSVVGIGPPISSPSTSSLSSSMSSPALAQIPATESCSCINWLLKKKLNRMKQHQRKSISTSQSSGQLLDHSSSRRRTLDQKRKLSRTMTESGSMSKAVSRSSTNDFNSNCDGESLRQQLKAELTIVPNGNESNMMSVAASQSSGQLLQYSPSKRRNLNKRKMLRTMNETDSTSKGTTRSRSSGNHHSNNSNEGESLRPQFKTEPIAAPKRSKSKMMSAETSQSSGQLSEYSSSKSRSLDGRRMRRTMTETDSISKGMIRSRSSSSSSSSSLYKQLRKGGMNEQKALRRQENYLKLIETIGYFE